MRGLKYKTAAEFDRAVDAYFVDREAKGLPPTHAGLALSMGFVSPTSLWNYRKKATFVDSTTRARAMLQDYAETVLFDPAKARGAMFTLKCNHGWREENKGDVEAVKVILVNDVRRTQGGNGGAAGAAVSGWDYK